MEEYQLQMKIKFTIIIFLLPILLLTAIPVASIGSQSNNDTNFSLPFNQLANVKFSTFFNNQQNLLDIYTISLSNNDFYLTNNTFSQNGNFYYHGLDIINSTALLDSTAIIQDFNYFLSNNSQFIVVSSTHNSINYLTIDILNTNTTFMQSSFSQYRLSTITRFTDSPDVYFSFYNTSTFTIIKYNFQTSSFSTFFKTANPPVGNQISDISVFSLDDKLYVSVASRNPLDFSNSDSNIFIFNDLQMIFSKHFPKIDINTFTSSGSGLLLYSMLNSTFFTYSFNDNSFTAFIPQMSNNYNLTTLSPFDNNSFLILNYNSINFIELQNTGTSISFQYESTYYIKNSNSPNDQNALQAFTIGSSKYYLFSGINQNNEFEITVQNAKTAPSSFLLKTTTITYVGTTP